MKYFKPALIFLGGLMLGYAIHGFRGSGKATGAAALPFASPTASVVAAKESALRPATPAPQATVFSLPSLQQALQTLMISEQPVMREVRLTDLGQRAADQNLDMAMEAMSSISDPKAKLAYMRGVFASVADNETADQAITHARSLERDLQLGAMGVLVSQWTKSDVLEGDSLAEISHTLMRSSEVSQDLKAGWLRAFEKHPLHGEMLGSLAALTVREDPEHALAIGKDLAGWQHQRFLKQLTTLWADEDPEASLAWAQANADQLTPATFGHLIAAQYDHKPDVALEVFASLQDPEQRRQAATAIAAIKAQDEGTQAAMAWADSLTNPVEQDSAHDRIYQETPRGIGALLSDYVDGLPVVMQTFPDTPAQSAGLLKGDRIVEVDSGHGEFTPTEALDGAIGLIRGEAGTPLRLRILRSGADGEMEDHVIELNRQQLVLPGR